MTPRELKRLKRAVIEVIYQDLEIQWCTHMTRAQMAERIAERLGPYPSVEWTALGQYAEAE